MDVARILFASMANKCLFLLDVNISEKKSVTASSCTFTSIWVPKHRVFHVGLLIVLVTYLIQMVFCVLIPRTYIRVFVKLHTCMCFHKAEEIAPTNFPKAKIIFFSIFKFCRMIMVSNSLSENSKFSYSEYKY